MKEAYLKSRVRCMNFIYNMIFTVKVYDGDGRKNPENEKDETKEKRFSPFGCPPITPSIKLETENKPDLP